MDPSQRMMGAFDQIELDTELDQLANKVLPDVNKQLGTKFPSAVVKRAWRQVVAGRNYHLLLETKEGNYLRYITAVVYIDLSQNTTVKEAKLGHFPPQVHNW